MRKDGLMVTILEQDLEKSRFISSSTTDSLCDLVTESLCASVLWIKMNICPLSTLSISSVRSIGQGTVLYNVLVQLPAY